MEKFIFDTAEAMGSAAAQYAVGIINQAIAQRGRAVVVLATGASQFEVYHHLVTMAVDWSKVTMFHLDEYIGLPITHPASFRKYLMERFIDRVNPLAAVHLIDGEHPDPAEECRRLGALIQASPVDVTLAGVGENGHLAFNDPPADFDTEEPYLLVNLDEACRRQQLGEGWFNSLAEVPERAISMSIRQIMKTDHLILSVPDRRKAQAIKSMLEGPISPQCPASIARNHPRCRLLLDRAAAGTGKES